LSFDIVQDSIVSGYDTELKVDLVNDIPFPFERLDMIKWIEDFDRSTIKEDFKAISEDIFCGNRNRLSQMA
jgi:hypothetical protein